MSASSRKAIALKLAIFAVAVSLLAVVVHEIWFEIQLRRPNDHRLRGGILEDCAYFLKPDGSALPAPGSFPPGGEVVECYDGNDKERYKQLTLRLSDRETKIERCSFKEPWGKSPKCDPGADYFAYKLTWTYLNFPERNLCKDRGFKGPIRDCDKPIKVPKDAAVVVRDLQWSEGAWEDKVTGTWEDEKKGSTNRFTVSCFSGAIAKCFHFGYDPQKNGPAPPTVCEDQYPPHGQPAGSISLRDVSQACIAAVRADYGGLDESYTCRGVPVDFEDRVGLQVRGAPDPRFPYETFEAEWAADGVVAGKDFRPRFEATEMGKIEDAVRARTAKAKGDYCEPNGPSDWTGLVRTYSGERPPLKKAGFLGSCRNGAETFEDCCPDNAPRSQKCSK